MKIYIEKFDTLEGFLLADFVSRDDFYLFCKAIETELEVEDRRTMLYITNLSLTEGSLPVEGKVYSIPSFFFEKLKWNKEPGFSGENTNFDYNFSNIIAFRSKANYMGKSFFEPPITYRSVYFRVKNAWTGPPCGAESLENELKVVVKNVGQGNWNEVYNGDVCKIIYDWVLQLMPQKRKLGT